MSEILYERTDKMADVKKKRALEEEEIESDGYFSTYSHFAIHEEMLKVVTIDKYHLTICMLNC